MNESEHETDKDLHGYQTGSDNLYGILKAYAAENRKHMTAAEHILWNTLCHNRYNIKFRRQHIIGDFIVDFVCLKSRLVIEIDGAYHAERNQQYSDEMRTKDLNMMGYEVIRFGNDDVFNDCKSVANQIYNRIFQIMQYQQTE
ncbi:MAG: endonuclease domain-containing protein [Prevotella sp.]|nr:endonuclease domain-containing protein [Prevotella sp.]MDY6240663.1 endonuclease domain-containing protein [Prevotella sp.]